MYCALFLLIFCFYQTNAFLQNILDPIKTAGEGVIKSVPELVKDTYGNILDINNIPDVPWVPVPELIQKEGYPVENHYVTTSDGYILNVHRIPRGISGLSNGKVVYLQHGLLMASSDWVLTGPKLGLAYILADEGYDVWMGNVRGNIYSKNHTTLSPKSKEFWQFSWHEIGIYDVPAIIDYILKKTNRKKLIHVGHSQGTTSYYVLMSERPEYNEKVEVHVSLAPIAFMTRLFSPLLRFISLGTTPLESLFSLIGKYEFMPTTGFLHKLSDAVCSEGLGKVLCKNALFALAGFSPKQMNASLVPILIKHYPAGAATRQLVHYGQEINSLKFQKYDYGFSNYMKYKSLTPPSYNLTRLTAPIHLIYGSNDWLAANSDVKKLYSNIPGGKELYNVPIQTWNHMDFLFGNDVVEQVYDKVRSILKLY